ncbi:YaaC family protein [Undibacterium sp. TJN19]|uniref:YaaC family protein n=1 Tax=Undibacterium sp. TJN19 TaxID=3413055 RepID=UPI003BF42A01
MRWIVTDNIYNETWRQLLEFSNAELTIDKIKLRHGSGKSKSDEANYLKQATQARVCVMQAKEYFDAARASTLFTRPNHVYYGAVALASLMMLVLGDGRKSLDYLRQDKKNNNHGLDFTTGCNAKMASSGTHLLENTHAEILKFGHFSNWYDVLPSVGKTYGMKRTNGKRNSSVEYSPVGTFNVCSSAELHGKKKKIIDLLRHMPDLTIDLDRFGIEVYCSRINLDTIADGDFMGRFSWRIHNCKSLDERDSILDKFRIAPKYANSFSWLGEDDAKVGIIELTLERELDFHFSWPSSRDNLNHESIAYADTLYTFEIVDLYILAYQLSMLSRYFPDIWVGCIESHCRAAKLIDLAVDTIVKKFPILALSMLASDEIIISTHRQPWLM